jgi:hypothetical protein
MKFKVLIAAFMFALALPVAADFRTIEQGHEVALSDLRLPQHESGTIAFKTCDDCSYMVKRVSRDTRWVVDGTSMSLEKFRRSVQRIADRDGTPVTVRHHLEEDRVTQVSVHPIPTRD